MAQGFSFGDNLKGTAHMAFYEKHTAYTLPHKRELMVKIVTRKWPWSRPKITNYAGNGSIFRDVETGERPDTMLELKMAYMWARVRGYSV